jgi:hypothetical protein
MPDNLIKIADSMTGFDTSLYLMKKTGKKKEDKTALTNEVDQKATTTKSSLSTASSGVLEFVYKKDKTSKQGISTYSIQESSIFNQTEVLSSSKSISKSNINSALTGFFAQKTKDSAFSINKADNTGLLSLVSDKNNTDPFKSSISATKDKTKDTLTLSRTAQDSISAKKKEKAKTLVAGTTIQSSKSAALAKADAELATKKKTLEIEKNYKSPSGKELSAQEKSNVDELKKRDREIKAHESAHKNAGGGLVQGAASFSYTTGPDGKSYAIAGEVKIDISVDANNPEETIQKMQRVRAAALAPSDPSPQDRSVAARAAAIEAEARAQLNKENSQQISRISQNNNQNDSALAVYSKSVLSEDIVGKIFDRVNTNLTPETLKRTQYTLSDSMSSN